MVDKLDNAKVVVLYIVIGAMSGIIQIGKERKRTKFEKLCVWLTSFCFAVFVTPLFIWILEISTGFIVPESIHYGVCFFSGQFGEKVLTLSLAMYREFDWKSIILALINRKGNKPN